MHYVYVLQSLKNGALYIGSTSNVVRRIREHNNSLSISTKRYVSWKCIYLEDYAKGEDARVREHKLKQRGQAI